MGDMVTKEELLKKIKSLPIDDRQDFIIKILLVEYVEGLDNDIATALKSHREEVKKHMEEENEKSRKEYENSIKEPYDRFSPDWRGGSGL
jgi:hypothetical protein